MTPAQIDSTCRELVKDYMRCHADILAPLSGVLIRSIAKRMARAFNLPYRSVWKHMRRQWLNLLTP